MRNFIASLVVLGFVGATQASDIPDRDERSRQTFCVSLANIAAASMKVRSEGKSLRFVADAYAPVIEKARYTFGPIAERMLRTQIELAFSDDEESPEDYGSDAFKTCKKILNVRNY